MARRRPADGPGPARRWPGAGLPTIHAGAQRVSLAAPEAAVRLLLERWAGETAIGRSRSGLETVGRRQRHGSAPEAWADVPEAFAYARYQEK